MTNYIVLIYWYIKYYDIIFNKASWYVRVKIMETISLNNLDSEAIKKKLLGIISKIIGKNTWTQACAAEKLGIDQPKVSQIKSGKTSGFSLERLLGFLEKLDHEITITITENQSVKAKEEKVECRIGS